MLEDSLILTVKDDFLDDPDDIVKWSESVEYWNKEDHPEDIGHFPGIRSLPLYDINTCLFGYIMHKLGPIYKEFGVEYREGIFNYNFSKLKKDSPQVMHRDNPFVEDDELQFAGVVYLNPDPPDPQESGTWVVIDEVLRKIENKYNRLIIYGGNMTHGPGPAWGETWDDCRLTLTTQSTFKISNMIKESEDE